MEWIHRFQLFLFDFDGLLVNTEKLQFQGYVDALAKRGYDLGWDFSRFCELAHLNSVALREAMWAQIPALKPIWNELYEEKKEAYFQLLLSGKVELMPGVEPLLEALEKNSIPRCVVTNSFFKQIAAIRSQNGSLQSIPHWLTREDYENPKPHPDGYLKAIQLYGKPGGRVIGFEDTLRGLEALKGTPALPVLICAEDHPLLKSARQSVPLHFTSFLRIKDLH